METESFLRVVPAGGLEWSAGLEPMFTVALSGITSRD